MGRVHRACREDNCFYSMVCMKPSVPSKGHQGEGLADLLLTNPFSVGDTVFDEKEDGL